MLVIEVYADVWCPFAHVGLRSVVRWRNELGRDDVIVRVRAWPLELVNGVPLDPTITAEHVDDLPAQVASDLFCDFDPGQFPRTSLPALAVAAAAYSRDDRTGEAVSVALRDALFEEGRDISRPDVLASVASTRMASVLPLTRTMRPCGPNGTRVSRGGSKDRRTSSAGKSKPFAHR